MTYVEDLIGLLSTKVAISIDPWDFKVVDSFNNTIFNSIGLTEKQRTLAIRIIMRNHKALQPYVSEDVAELMKNPQFRLSVRKSIENNSIKIVEVDKTKVVEVKFPYNEALIEKIKKYRNSAKNFVTVSWDKPRLAWLFSLNEENIEFISNELSNENCEHDEEFQNYVTQVKNIINNIDNLVPILTLIDGVPKIKNIQVGMPQITETEIVPALFEARKFGVTYWDENIDAQIRSAEFDSVTADFLTSTNSFDIGENGKNCLKNVIKYLSPSLFIIPGGSEFKKIKEIYALLHSMQIDMSKVSVLFRLPNETGQKFNDFVKNQGLNNPINSDTSIVCISSKLPKTILKSKIEFNSVINFGFNNAHYSLKEFVKNHQNLVFFQGNLIESLQVYDVS